MKNNKIVQRTNKNINKNKPLRSAAVQHFELRPFLRSIQNELTWISGFPPHWFITLNYAQLFSVSIATTVGVQQTMNLNSVFDPDRTGTGHQNMCLDTLSTIYNRYRVYAVDYEVIFHNTTGTYSAVVGPTNSLLPAAVTNQATYEAACEQPFMRPIVVPGNGGYPVTVSGRCYLDVVNGCSKEEYRTDDRFEAQIAASPTEIITLPIGIYNPTVATILVNFQVKLKMFVDFHDIIAQPSS